ncbi:MAG: hypothetical protein V3R68_08550 [Gammaproteobacteria bacterium]
MKYRNLTTGIVTIAGVLLSGSVMAMHSPSSGFAPFEESIERLRSTETIEAPAKNDHKPFYLDNVKPIKDENVSPEGADIDNTPWYLKG